MNLSTFGLDYEAFGLGGSGDPDKKNSARSGVTRKRGSPAFDSITEIHRQSTWELQTFKERWNQAVAEDKNWVDRFSSTWNRVGNNRRLKRSSVIKKTLTFFTQIIYRNFFVFFWGSHCYM
ncbi:PREDICTED: uncharacterized protein LOC104748294 [Camelina sativa]|uniref:Uncharacterized protein LOC104748294 n=1 Tax=Camelina sativa TaxID=90675 RepID=A0ABM1R0E7_CAMSA|nr:PREDICTED: uncharacterized protein LOC104748294 [Camelina sativa]